MSIHRFTCVLVLAGGACVACGGDDGDDGGGGDDRGPPDSDAPGIDLPPGFRATVFADQIGRARHVAVTSGGDVLVAVAPEFDGTPGHVMALRDDDGDGVSDREHAFAEPGAHGIAWAGDHLYVGFDDRVVRYSLRGDSLEPGGGPVTIVAGLPADGDHPFKTIVVDGDALYVNMGSATNSCQDKNRVLHSPGVDPCPELAVRAGIWRFDRNRVNQTQADGVRVATGVRNGTALAVDPATGALWTAINGRDQLFENWPELYTELDDQVTPSEELVQIDEGDDYGWPYCYWDDSVHHRVLAPEYGGDGNEAGRCATIPAPEMALPAHWAMLGMAFADGDAWPQAWRGMFVTAHGSRFVQGGSEPPGYNVIHVTMENGKPTSWRPFATGFAGDQRPLPAAAAHRPVGVAVAPDGALYITDDWNGRVWRVTAAR